MLQENVVQPLLVSMSAIRLASECVRSILKIDDVVSGGGVVGDTDLDHKQCCVYQTLLSYCAGQCKITYVCSRDAV